MHNSSGHLVPVLPTLGAQNFLPCPVGARPVPREGRGKRRFRGETAPSAGRAEGLRGTRGARGGPSFPGENVRPFLRECPCPSLENVHVLPWGMSPSFLGKCARPSLGSVPVLP